MLNRVLYIYIYVEINYMALAIEPFLGQARRELQNTEWQCGKGSVALRQAEGRSSSLEVRLASLEDPQAIGNRL